MASSVVDWVELKLAPHTWAIAIAAMVWFWLGVAIQARFIRLPDLPWMPPDAVVLWSGIAANAVWWGFLRPALETRRKARLAAGAGRPD